MTDPTNSNPDDLPFQLASESTPLPTPSTPPPSSPSRSFSPFVYIIGGLLLGICVCAGLLITMLGASFSRSLADQKPIEQLLDRYMRHMDRKEVDEACALFSDYAQQEFPKSEIQAFVNGSNYAVFEGYQRLTVTHWEVKAQAGQGLPAGTIVITRGTVFYEGGIEGSFEATSQENEGQWQLLGFFVTVPPSKFDQ